MSRRIGTLCFVVMFAAFCYIVKSEIDKDLLELRIARFESERLAEERGFKSLAARNSCYIDAALFKEALEVKGRLENKNFQPKILFAQFVKLNGHALVTFYHDGRWRVWDETGTASLIFQDPSVRPEPEVFARAMSEQYINAKWMP